MALQTHTCYANYIWGGKQFLGRLKLFSFKGYTYIKTLSPYITSWRGFDGISNDDDLAHLVLITLAHVGKHP